LKTIISVFLSVWVAVFSVGSTFAVPIIVNDGDRFTYSPASEYYFAAELSESNPMVTFGVDISRGDAFEFVVTAPAAFDLFARLSTGSNFGGFAIAGPVNSRLFAGESFTFPVDGDYFVGQTQWLSIAFTDMDLAVDYLATLPGGVLPIGGIASSPATNTSFLGGGNVLSPIPEPGTVSMMGVGLLMILFLGYTRRKGRQVVPTAA